MAGTLTISTLSDGTNSTSATNCIQGSAKAWARFGSAPSIVTIGSSYNITSITYNSVGDFTINFTNAFVDGNYAMTASSYAPNDAYTRAVMFKNGTTPTASSCRITNSTGSNGSIQDTNYMGVAFFR